MGRCTFIFNSMLFYKLPPVNCKINSNSAALYSVMCSTIVEDDHAAEIFVLQAFICVVKNNKSGWKITE